VEPLSRGLFAIVEAVTDRNFVSLTIIYFVRLLVRLAADMLMEVGCICNGDLRHFISFVL
jgi:hypothetical protein